MRTLCHYGRLEQVMKEMIKYKIGIFGLCQMRWTGSGKMKEDEKSILGTFKGTYTGSRHILELACCKSSGWLETSQ